MITYTEKKDNCFQIDTGFLAFCTFLYFTFLYSVKRNKIWTNVFGFVCVHLRVLLPTSGASFIEKAVQVHFVSQLYLYPGEPGLH